MISLKDGLITFAFKNKSLDFSSWRRSFHSELYSYFLSEELLCVKIDAANMILVLLFSNSR